MSILTLSSPIKEILGKIGGEPESRAISLLISGIKENLKECELEILDSYTLKSENLSLTFIPTKALPSLGGRG